MKRILLVTAVLGFVSAKAQLATPVNDSIEMGATYLNDVYYSLGSGAQTMEPNNNWQLAFRTGIQTDGIRVNTATATGSNDGSAVVYTWPNGDISDFANFDTTNYLSWESFENDETTWEIGALNQASTGFPDVSWGTYNMTTHVVTGDSVYLLVYNYQGATGMRKLYVDKKEAGDWTFTIAKIDGSDEQTVTLKSSDYSGKNFIYYNVESMTALDREPANWDFVMTRYSTEAAPGQFAGTTGALSNVGLVSIEAEGKPVDDLKFDDYKQDSTDAINTIGYDWKHYTFGPGGVTWNVSDSLAYFIKDQNDLWFKLVWTGFEGSTTGKAFFTKTQLTTGVGIVTPTSAIQSTALYPNPSSDRITLITEMMDASDAVIRIVDAQGRIVESLHADLNSGVNQNNFTVSHLNNGVYFLQVEAANSVQNIRFVKN